MIERKKKLLIIQFLLLFLGLIIFSITYLKKSTNSDLINAQNLIEMSEKEDGNLFYNIEYSGIDLAGNRYIIKSEKAESNLSNENLIDMTGVTAVFYFKDETILEIKSDFGIYNNDNLDIKFEKNVYANYKKSVLKAQLAEYYNDIGKLIISDNVFVNDIQGNLKADKLVFDVNDKTLEIESFNNNKINVNVSDNEKRF
tara:strand:- start:1095 stop:1691 length:597 start_codon:yes stop_codon:yes gene_type:complete